MIRANDVLNAFKPKYIGHQIGTGHSVEYMLYFDELIGNRVSKGAKIRNRNNQVPYLTQDTNGKVTMSQLDTTNERQEVSPLPAGDQETLINRRRQRHRRHKTEKKT